MARRKEGLQVDLLSWNPGGLRLRIITCYCINSLLIHSPKTPSLGGRGHLHLTFPNIYILGLDQFFFFFFAGIIYIFIISTMVVCRRSTDLGSIQIKIAAISYFYLCTYTQ